MIDVVAYEVRQAPMLFFAVSKVASNLLVQMAVKSKLFSELNNIE